MNNNFTLAESGAADIFPSAGYAPQGALQLLSPFGGKGGTFRDRLYVTRGGCPVGQGRLVQQTDYYDTNGKLIKSDWVYLTDCLPLTELEAMLGRLEGGKV